MAQMSLGGYHKEGCEAMELICLSFDGVEHSHSIYHTWAIT